MCASATPPGRLIARTPKHPPAIVAPLRSACVWGRGQMGVWAEAVLALVAARVDADWFAPTRVVWTPHRPCAHRPCVVARLRGVGHRPKVPEGRLGPDRCCPSGGRDGMAPWRHHAGAGSGDESCRSPGRRRGHPVDGSSRIRAGWACSHGWGRDVRSRPPRWGSVTARCDAAMDGGGSTGRNGIPHGTDVGHRMSGIESGGP